MLFTGENSYDTINTITLEATCFLFQICIKQNVKIVHDTINVFICNKHNRMQKQKLYTELITAVLNKLLINKYGTGWSKGKTFIREMLGSRLGLS
jgi:hypothetical protein